MSWHGLAFDGTARERLGVDAGHFRGSDDHGMLLDSGQTDEELLTSWREVAGVVFAAALPSPLAEPTLICHSTSALLALGVTATPTAAELCGNVLPAAALPAAHCYAGHQFGNFAGQLGDGAAISLGEVVTPSGELRELGFKGTGPTPFTQEALTGRKQVGSMVVELIVAEALAALGVPTARGLGVVTGAPTEGGDACAVLARSATSFLRFGSLEVCLPHHHDLTDRHAPSAGDTALLQRLADYCIASYGCFRQIAAVPDDDEEEDEELRAAPRYTELVLEIARRTARLTAAWQLLGACHGMLNSDNLSVTGESLDHGSFAFMDHASPGFAGRYKLQDDRYRYENQPVEARKACEQLAVAMQPLHCTRPLEMRAAVAAAFESAYSEAHGEGMRRKLGLRVARPELACELVSLMLRTGADWTCTFRLLSCDRPVATMAAEVAGWCAQPNGVAWGAWLDRYAAVLAAEAAEAGAPSASERAATMRATNPAVVPRRWLLEAASSAAEAGEYPEVNRLLGLLTHPYEEPTGGAEAQPPRARTSVVSGGEVPPVDAARLGVAGPRAVQALEDATFWRRLCPELTVLSTASAALAQRTAPFSLGEAREEQLRASMRNHGYFALQPGELPWSVDLGALARGIELLHAAGWPPAFIMAYDEAWLVAAQMAPLLERLTGNPLSFDWMAFRVPPGQPGFPPHRDKSLGLSGESGMRADGTARYNTCWIALVDVPHTSSCLMCVPRGHDSGYLASSESHNPVASTDALCHVQPLPLDKGGAAVFSHRLFHWSRGGNTHTADGAPAPARFALAITSIDESYDVRYLPQTALPLPPLPIRVALAAGQVFAYSNHERAEIDAELLWATFLAMSHHFDDSWVRRVFEAKHRTEA